MNFVNYCFLTMVFRYEQRIDSNQNNNDSCRRCGINCNFYFTTEFVGDCIHNIVWIGILFFNFGRYCNSNKEINSMCHIIFNMTTCITTSFYLDISNTYRIVKINMNDELDCNCNEKQFWGYCPKDKCLLDCIICNPPSSEKEENIS